MLAAITRRAQTISKDKKPPDGKLNSSDNDKAKYPGFLRNVSDYFTEYSSNTSIHGIKYLGEPKRSLLEKLWWLLVFAASLYMCTSMIMKTYEKWQTSPVIVSFARSPTPVWRVPFPAVTICSETKSRQTIYNFTEQYHRGRAKNLTAKEEAEFEQISLVCDNHLHPYGNDTIGWDTVKLLAHVAPPFEETFYQCTWMNKLVNCSDLFIPMLTEDGICFTFNMLDRYELLKSTVNYPRGYQDHGIKSTNWTLESGYPKELGRNAYPKRAISAGQGAGLTVLLRGYEKDLDYVCKGPVQGFKFLLHHPAEVPRLTQQYFRAPLNQEVVVAIKPDMMTTSDGLKDYNPHRRQCYFSNERQLSFYEVYTQQNCEVECLTNYTLDKCGCVSYHMPHIKNTPLCGAGKTRCTHNAQLELISKEVDKNLDNHDQVLSYSTNSKDFNECDCLPACTSLTYNSENSQADFNWPKVFQASKLNATGLTGAKMTGATLFFKEMQFITSERNELYGPTDFLASCGGLLGLFMGFSILSVIEIFYFLSLRLMCNLRYFGYHFWSGAPSELEHKD